MSKTKSSVRGKQDKKIVVVKPYVNFKNIDDVTIVEPRNIG